MPIKETECDIVYKVLIVGDSGVGKSAILNCLVGRKFNERSRPTVGVDFVTKIVEADGALIHLRVWDTAGLENFRSMTRRQFHGVQGVVLVYDVTNRKSFESMKYWLSTIPNVTPQTTTVNGQSYEPIPFIVMSNKSDLTDGKKVSTSQGMKMANKAMAFGFHETSAKTGTNIFNAFQKLAFTITDINHPKLMKSYHPYLIRPLGTRQEVMRSSLPVTHDKIVMPSSNRSSRNSSSTLLLSTRSLSLRSSTSILIPPFTFSSPTSSSSAPSSFSSSQTNDNVNKNRRKEDKPRRRRRRRIFSWLFGKKRSSSSSGSSSSFSKRRNKKKDEKEKHEVVLRRYSTNTSKAMRWGDTFVPSYCGRYSQDVNSLSNRYSRTQSSAQSERNGNVKKRTRRSGLLCACFGGKPKRKE